MVFVMEADDQTSGNSTNEGDVLAQARKLLAEGEIEKSLVMVRGYWLENPDDAEAAALLSELMAESGRSDLSKRLSKLAEQLPLNQPPVISGQTTLMPESPNQSVKENNATAAGGKELFEAGYSLIDARQHELAAMLLNRAAQLVPGEPTVNYELSFALMSMKRFEQAIPYLEQLLDKNTDFDTLLNLLVCYVLTRQPGKAQETLRNIGQLKLEPEQQQEFNHQQFVVKRLDHLGTKNHLNSRDWLYILYGTLLLRPSMRNEVVREDAASIGLTLAILKGVLEGLDLQPEVIEFYGQQSRPLAQALSEFLEIPLSGYKGPARSEQALLTMTWATDIIGPHKSFVTRQKNRNLFSYALPWDEPLPLAPEIVGCLAYSEPMPWHEHTSDLIQASDLNLINSSQYSAEIEKAYKNILSHARDLESDPGTIKSTEDAIHYYENKKPYLVLGNTKTFPSRCEYTAEALD